LVTPTATSDPIPATGAAPDHRRLPSSEPRPNLAGSL